MMADLLCTEHLVRRIEGDVPTTLVNDASVTIGAGEFVAITGPSGSGKSSLLYLLGLLDTPTSGEVYLKGRPTARLGEEGKAAIRLREIGFVFQSYFLLPEFTAEENVMLPMRRLGHLPDADIRKRAATLLDRLGLSAQRSKLPRQMSGGQNQRVAIARALANDPPLILADEPTGNLDSSSSALVMDIIQSLAVEGRSIVMVTHDPEFARRARRNIHIVDGRIQD